MTATTTKPELYELVQALHRNGANTVQIAAALGYTPPGIQKILITLGIDRRRSLTEIIATLDENTRLRLQSFNKETRRHQQTTQAA